MTSLQDPQRLHTTSSSSSLLDLASNLVSPKSFLFNTHHKTPPPSLPPQRASTMDKAQQPSSFQQLEKVRAQLFWGLSYRRSIQRLTVNLSSSSERVHMPPYVHIFRLIITDHFLNRPFHDRAISMLKEGYHRFSRGEIARPANLSL